MAEAVDVIREACLALAQHNDVAAARDLLRRHYPFTACSPSKRSWTRVEALRIYLRDGCVDRYSGQRLVFPGIFRVLSKLLPEEFPAHRNWRMSETHIAYWTLIPTIDHVVPVARGGIDNESNWVTTSMLRNSAKSCWTLQELG